MLSSHRIVTSAIAVISLLAIAFAQQGRGRGAAPPRLVLSVTSDAWADGGEVPMHHSGRGDNKSPAFEFHWTLGGNAVSAPENLQTYAVIFHDLENSTNKTTTDTLHWTAFNIPGTAKGLSEGLGTGDLQDGTRNGPGIIARGGTQPGGYFGPGAGPGPFHHYVFEFYALDTKLDLPANTTREELLKAMDGHVIGKAAFFGRYHGPAAQ
ncbi:MAG TPA: YbhB/YbcL family Raf kinase inhibitor-like protein [Bryobacteraceae bacterium]|nr:YbhB/YbcL family Raf kinase inhibitor-like protein [Bryobacteraceae bacterium]